MEDHRIHSQSESSTTGMVVHAKTVGNVPGTLGRGYMLQQGWELLEP